MFASSMIGKRSCEARYSSSRETLSGASLSSTRKRPKAESGSIPPGARSASTDVSAETIATRAISRLRDEYEVELSLKEFFANPSVRGLAEVIEELILQELEDLDE